MLLYHIVSGSSSSRLDAWTDISNQGWSSAMPPLRQVANFWRSTALSRSATKLSPDLDKITLARWQLSWLADWEVLVPLETDASDADSSRNSSGFQVKNTESGVSHIVLSVPVDHPMIIPVARSCWPPLWVTASEPCQSQPTYPHCISIHPLCDKAVITSKQATTVACLGRRQNSKCQAMPSISPICCTNHTRVLGGFSQDLADASDPNPIPMSAMSAQGSETSSLEAKTVTCQPQLTKGSKVGQMIIGGN